MPRTKKTASVVKTTTKKHQRSILSPASKTASNFNSAVKQKITGYITAALGLIAGLAWNDAIKSMIDMLFPATENSVIAKFGYAFLMTIVLVSVSLYLVRLIQSDMPPK